MRDGLDVERPMATDAQRKATNVFDPATLLGLGGALALVVAALMLGGAPLAFVDVPSILIVLGGTALLTLASFTLADVGATFAAVLRTVSYQRRDPSAVALDLLRLADGARKAGLLSLQAPISNGEIADPLLAKGLSMLVDGMKVEEAEELMRRELGAMLGRHRKSASVLRRAAEIAPAMGLIGTLIGLVQMLGRLDDPAAIGPAMAVALLTTFYGAVLAHMMLNPLASKLERNSAEETLVGQLNVVAAGSIGRQENPRRLEMLLNSLMPPARRIRYFD
ncbi:Chemotaxis protein [uncultured Alphaproteobacteria bacterium]|uniref:Chemotaxis protein n=1 Tax=uncultured Alphaproteobacteria bacterium TaxID=91750 RepID=A0A212JQG9_9PROT|nr:Chemotaxis protein [uncultured Alphaproteobacteria bacterium]